MAKLTKKQKEAVAKLEKNKAYSLEEASALVKEVNTAKFDASVDIAVRLGVDPRKANQMVRRVKISVYWLWLLLIKKQKQKLLVLTM